MTKNRFKKLLSGLLAVCLLATLFVNIPLTASAVSVSTASDFTNAINNAGTSAVTEINVSGTISVSGGTYYNKHIKFTGSGTVNLTSMLYFDNGCDIEFAGPSFTVSGNNRLIIGYTSSGSVKITFTSGSFNGNIQAQANTTMTINGGTFTNTSSYSYSDDARDEAVVCALGGGTVNINGGSFTKGTHTEDIYCSSGTLTVKGGTFDKNPGNYVPTSGYMVVRDATTGIYSISTDIPSGAQYINSADDFTSKKSGILIINKDLTDVSGVGISSGTVTYMGAGSVKFKDTNTNALTVTGGANVTIDGPTFNQGAESRALCVWEATVTFNSGGVIGDIEQQGGTSSTGTLIINGGTFTQTEGNNLIDNRSSTKGGTTTINGGTFTKVGSTAPFTTTGNITFQIKGGTFNFDPSAYVASGYVARQSGSNYVVGEKSYEAKIGNTYYDTLSGAITAASSGATIEILDEISTGNSLGVDKNLTFTGDHTVTFTGGTGLTVATTGITVTINGPTFKQGGATRALCVWMATVIVDNGGFIGLIDQQGGDATNKGILTINDGTFTQDSSCTNFASGKQAWLVNSSSNAYAETTINGGTFIGNGTQAFINATMGKVTIKGGNFTKAAGQTGIETSANCTLSVTGGTYNFNPAGVASGYKATENPTGTWTVAIDDSKQAKIENTEYKTLAEAVTAARDGDTIEILDNISGAAQINTKDITAKKLTFIGNYTVTFGSGSGLTANTGSHITINGPTFVQGSADRALCVYDGTVDIISGGITGWIQNQGGATSQGVLNIYDGTFTQGSGHVLLDTRVALRGETNIYGGTFVGAGASELFDIQEDTALNISGGSFTKTDSQNVFTTGDNTHASKIISGGSFNFDPTEWLAWGCTATLVGDTYTVSAEPSESNGILRFAGRKNDSTRTKGMFSQRIALAANTTYTFSLKYREVGGAKKAIVLSGVTLGNPTENDTSYSVTFTTGTDGGTLTVSLGRSDTEAGKGAAVYFADVKCVANGGTQNLVKNGDFKQGVKDWFVFAGNYAPKNAYMAVGTVKFDNLDTFFNDQALADFAANKAIEIECAEGTTETFVKFYSYLEEGSYKFSYKYRALGDEVLIDYSSTQGVSMTEVDDGEKYLKTYDVNVGSAETKDFTIYFKYLPTGAKMYFSDIKLYKVDGENTVGTNILADINPIFSEDYQLDENGRYEFTLPAGDDDSVNNIVGHGFAAQWGVTVPAAIIETPVNFFTDYDANGSRANVRKVLLGLEEKAKFFERDINTNLDTEIDIRDLVRLDSILNRTFNANGDIENLKAEILGAGDTDTSSFSKIIYVNSEASSNGNGTEATPYKSLETAISNASSGSAVLLKRGSVFRTPSSYTSQYTIPAGVTLGSYGETGDKPQILGSDKNYAENTTWNSQGNNIWTVSLDSGHSADMVGNVYLIDANGNITIGCGIKDGAYITATSSLTKNGDFYWAAASNKNSSTLYMYCDQNPSSKYSRIEFARNKSVLTLSSNVTVDNIAIFFGGQHGINGSGLSNVTITNCEIGYIGGAVNDDGAGLGNGIQWGQGGSNITANHNYVYQCYDAGISPQSWSTDKPFTNVKITNNLLTDNFYNVEFWTSGNAAFNGFEITGNIMHRSGYGWSWDKRITGHNLAPLSGQIYGSKSYNNSDSNNIIISGNTFSESRANIISWCWGDDEGVEAAKAKNLTAKSNTYYQSWGSNNGQLMLYGDILDSEFYKGASQGALEGAVSQFDIDPLLVAWIEQEWLPASN